MAKVRDAIAKRLTDATDALTMRERGQDEMHTMRINDGVRISNPMHTLQEEGRMSYYDERCDACGQGTGPWDALTITSGPDGSYHDEGDCMPDGFLSDDEIYDRLRRERMKT